MASAQVLEDEADKPDMTHEPDKLNEPNDTSELDRLNEPNNPSELDKPERLAQMNKRFKAGLLLYDTW